ncbi:hypothetical protein SADUNF_Sadunf03G0066800 [Salix dunnii]|uniref:Uncharacterized protein n=1 Tax=Salix dunnii TaxID=1413687 RepID=A0A835KGJ5_9ROSI|nr:hypothetical protein SADUNF_Sadunf03G0066800 [Salix dunnii]
MLFTKTSHLLSSYMKRGKPKISKQNLYVELQKQSQKGYTLASFELMNVFLMGSERFSPSPLKSLILHNFE